MFPVIVLSQPYATPDAMGYGANTRGAYGLYAQTGDPADLPVILYVTNLSTGIVQDSDSSGSFEWCLSRSYPRIVVFKVGGVIDYRPGTQYGSVTISQPYLTVYGQTAPFPGITIIGSEYRITNSHNIIIQHIKIRLGDDPDMTLYQSDAFLVIRSYNVFIDHCSFMWSQDEIFDIVGGSPSAYNITLSNSLLVVPFVYSNHVNEGSPFEPEIHGMGPYLSADSNLTFARNITAYSFDRSPWMNTPINVQGINNYSLVSDYVTGFDVNVGGATINHDYVGNHTNPTQLSLDQGGSYYKNSARVNNVSTSSLMYFDDNKCLEGDENPGNTDWQNVFFNVSLTEQFSMSTPLVNTTVIDADSVKSHVLKYAGAWYWNRDDYDQYVIDSINTGQINYRSSPDSLPARAYNYTVYGNPYGNAGNVSGGVNWAADDDTIIVNSNQVILNINCPSADSIISYLNTVLPSGTSARLHDLTDYVIIESDELGPTASITVANETGQQGLGVFGMIPGTYYGEEGMLGWPSYTQTSHSLELPDDPHGDDDLDGYTNLEEWAYELQDTTQSSPSPPPTGSCDTLALKTMLDTVFFDFGTTSFLESGWTSVFDTVVTYYYDTIAITPADSFLNVTNGYFPTAGWPDNVARDGRRIAPADGDSLFYTISNLNTNYGYDIDVIMSSTYSGYNNQIVKINNVIVDTINPYNNDSTYTYEDIDVTGGDFTISIVDYNAENRITINGMKIYQYEESDSLPLLPSLSAIIVNATDSLANGSIDLTVTSGTTPYSYLWSPGGDTIQDLSNKISGNYTVVVTDSNTCTVDSTFTIGEDLSVTAVIVNEINANGFASITQTVTGGVPPYTYLWNTSATTKDLVGIHSGFYTVTITDDDSNVIQRSYKVLNLLQTNGFDVNGKPTLIKIGNVLYGIPNP
jgi:hypothetical protein